MSKDTEPLFICENCGIKTDTGYFDKETGRTLCTKCFNETRREFKDAKIADLEAKLTESEKALEAKESVNRMYKATLSLKDSDFSDLVRENAKLKQQLAEKEVEIENCKEEHKFVNDLSNYFETLNLQE